MTALTIIEATKEICDKFVQVWPYTCHYPNMDFKVPAKSEIWARWQIQYNWGGQGSLANVEGNRRWMREGTVIIQVFTPLNIGQETRYNAVETIVNAYEGKRTPSDVWFRNVRFNEVIGGTEVSGWQQTNVYIDFLFDQIH